MAAPALDHAHEFAVGSRSVRNERAGVTRRGWSRREFLRRGSICGGGLWIALHVPRPRALRGAAASSRPAVLGEIEWKTVEAMTGRIIPTDREPAASQARCVSFIDRALAQEDRAARPLYALGVERINALAKERHGRLFFELVPAQQDALLAALELDRPPGWPGAGPSAPVFLAMLRAHTVIGCLADPIGHRAVGRLR
jgi:gluconate 2-dehydrogenase gamma chain